MAMFAPFRKATQAEAPKLLAAKIADAQAKAHARALRNKTAMDAGTMYNVGMGDKSPIYDSMFGAEGGGGPAVNEGAAQQGMGAEGSLSDSLFGTDPNSLMGKAATDTGTQAATETGVEQGIYDQIMGEGAAELGTEVATDAAVDLGTDAAVDVGTQAATDALVQGGTDALVAGGTEAAGTSALTGALGAAGTALPPLLMAAMLSRALGMWS